MHHVYPVSPTHFPVGAAPTWNCERKGILGDQLSWSVNQTESVHQVGGWKELTIQWDRCLSVPAVSIGHMCFVLFLLSVQSLSHVWLFVTLFFLYLQKELFIFTWRIIVLQYCDHFCHISAWISHRYTYIPPSWNSLPPPTPFSPSRFSQSPGLSSPESYSNTTIYFAYCSIYVSMSLSLLPSSPPPCTMSTSLFSMSASLLLPWK